MASASRTTICDVPTEMLISIFSYLPITDMARCAATCERWRGVVTGFTHLWKGKAYRSNKRPTDCPETRAVIHALPPLQEINVDTANHFWMEIYGSYIVLYVTDWSVLKNCQSLRCERLSTTMDIAGDILSHRSFIDFEGLKDLRITRTWTPNIMAPRDYSADYVIRTAMNMCPSLKHLAVCAVTAEHLDAVEEIGRLRCLAVSCLGVLKLSFLRHCSEALEELQLLRCIGLPSRELVELQQLRNLRSLLLGDCRFQQGDLVAAVAGLGNLVSLTLYCCTLIKDLSILQNCAQLSKLRITNSKCDPLVTDQITGEQLRLENLQIQKLRLPTDTEFCLARVLGVALTAYNLSAALSRLKKLGLTSSCLSYLGALHHCSQLRRLCCDFVREEEEEPVLGNVRVHIHLRS